MFAFRKLTTIGLAIGAMIAGLVAFQPEAKAFELPESWRGGLQSYGWDNNPYSRGNRYDLVCTSKHYRNQTCRLPRGVNGHIKLIEQISDAPCTRGQTWGAGERRVWVSDGCRAVFRIGNRGGSSGGGSQGGGGYGSSGGGSQCGGSCGGGDPYNPYHHQSRKGQLSCGSPHGEYRTCHLKHAKHRHVRLKRQTSNSSCIRGATWGVKANKVWVNEGCRGIFSFKR